MAAFKGTKINPQSFHVSQIKFLIILIPVAVIMALPIVYIFNHAFKPLNELFAWPPRFFVINPTTKNFRDLFAVTSTTGIPMSRYLFNSVVITFVTVVLSIVISSLAGFALSKLDFKIKRPLMLANNIALMFVGSAVIIPRYLVIERLGLIDTFWVHILPGLAIPVGLFLIKQFIDQIPKDLIEASRIDGASDIRIYFTIILPLIKPAIATIAIVSFQGVWNNTETSMNYINNESLKTFAFYMSTLTTTSNTVAGQGMAAAASLIMFIPNLVIFIFLQKNVMNTMAHSGIK
ncbi:MAG: carbohydrate ABC transporter permease [Paracholeplasma sp.]|jgi:ABC-type glycerol-3-phosphate transport system permease component|uniref:Putative sugar ABC transporter, permease n=1 Tax=Acholeplasma brassicae TaxID=61635 RepID=U4KMU9_9MOLU|nr:MULTISPECIES: carbohydrate ABC transporter permease [Paracholeplasma]MDY3196035.1 carbohydrate ABC transporter permease [Paracholeplasma sp.]CCV65481.1 putative sugar ABC transporter, permease [Paracholeplasma brassicae]